MIEIENVTKVYQMGEVEVHALRGVSLQIEQGEWVAIMGPSGSGKSTLMHLIGCLDTPTSGSYQLDGAEVGGMDDNQLAIIRNRQIGFVFQTFNLLPRTSALKQVMLPMQYSRDGARVSASERKQRAQEALEMVGLGDRVDHQPTEISGGEQQRVAIARALVNDPAIIMADEPTGNLDSKAGAEVMEILHRLHRDKGITVVMVTHDEEIGQQAERIVRLRDGIVVNGMIHVLLYILNDPDSPRFDVDRMPDGTPTMFGTLKRNIDAEVAAMKFGLAPGQIRMGLKILKSAVQSFDHFILSLKHDMYFVEPLYYHNAIIFERYGFAYAKGRRLMERIQSGFTPGGEYDNLLDGSSPFRLPGATQSIRLRSWAIHDLIMDEPFTDVTMYRRIGSPSQIRTSENCYW